MLKVLLLACLMVVAPADSFLGLEKIFDWVRPKLTDSAIGSLMKIGGTGQTPEKYLYQNGIKSQDDRENLRTVNDLQNSLMNFHHNLLEEQDQKLETIMSILQLAVNVMTMVFVALTAFVVARLHKRFAAKVNNRRISRGFTTEMVSVNDQNRRISRQLEPRDETIVFMERNA